MTDTNDTGPGDIYVHRGSGQFEHMGNVTDLRIQQDYSRQEQQVTDVLSGDTNFSFSLKLSKGTRKKFREAFGDPVIQQRTRTKNSYMRRMQRGQ